MKKVLSKAAFLAVLTGTALFTGACSQSSSGKAAATMAEPGIMAETAAPGMGEMQNNDYGYQEGAAESWVDDSASYEGELTGSGGYTAEKAVVQTGRKLIRNVDMEVEADDFDALLANINSRITSLGGYVEQSSVSGRRAGYQNHPYPRGASIIARIPSDKLDSFVTSVEEAGNVVNKSETTEDITLKYSDIESRKKSLTVEQDRIWALLEKADTLESVIVLEQRLSEIRYELESMESQLKLYDNQVDYSTVTLSISEVIEYTPTAPVTVGQRINRGFSGTVNAVSDFLVGLLVLLISLSPVWVPIAVIAAIIFLRLRSVKHRTKNGLPDGKESHDSGKQN